MKIDFSSPFLYDPKANVAFPDAHENPVPDRAVATRATASSAANMCGVGRVLWSDVQQFTAADTRRFAEASGFGSFLGHNAKTLKPRPSGNLGVIYGLALAPHYYANLLAVLDPASMLTTTKKLNEDQRAGRALFNNFDGSRPALVEQQTGVGPKDMLNFCVGSTQWCRQTCLVLTGNNPSSVEAVRAKISKTQALLADPAQFVAGLFWEMKAKAKAAQKAGVDLVVRLNMLSDIPWYICCPELLESLAGEVAFYDYTKVPFWKSADYGRVEELLDLTFSFAGGPGSEKLCAEALRNGVRVACAFAPADTKRATTLRTSFQEIAEASGLLDEDGNIDLFGGRYPLVDGDESDYRIDDPAPSIVSLAFKESRVSGEAFRQREAQSRKHFAKDVPDPTGVGEAYATVLRKKHWKASGIDPTELPVHVVLGLDAEHSAGRRNPGLPVLEPAADVGSGGAAAAQVSMFPIGDSGVLIGPHVPTILND